MIIYFTATKLQAGFKMWHLLCRKKKSLSMMNCGETKAALQLVLVARDVSCNIFNNSKWCLEVPDAEPYHVPDKRTDPWPLVYSPVPVSLIFLVYLCVVWVGPRLMKHRRPVDLRVVLIVYNFVMVGLSAYMFHEVCLCWFLTGKLNQSWSWHWLNFF